MRNGQASRHGVNVVVTVWGAGFRGVLSFRRQAGASVGRRQALVGMAACGTRGAHQRDWICVDLLGRRDILYELRLP